MFTPKVIPQKSVSKIMTQFYTERSPRKGNQRKDLRTRRVTAHRSRKNLRVLSCTTNVDVIN